MNTTKTLMYSPIELTQEILPPLVELVCKDTLYNSYLFTYFATNNIHYLNEARKIKPWEINSMNFIWQRNIMMGAFT